MVLLVAVWLLGTLHCGLEAAVELFAAPGTEATGCCNTTGDTCATDGCETVEGAFYLSDSTNLKIAAPPVLADDFFSAVPSTTTAPAGSESCDPGAFARASDWTPSWQFVRRAAPWPGAPSFAVI